MKHIQGQDRSQITLFREALDRCFAYLEASLLIATMTIPRMNPIAPDRRAFGTVVRKQGCWVTSAQSS